MNLSIVLSTHAAQFKAVAFKGDFETNLKNIASYGYDGVEVAIRDPRLVDHDQLLRLAGQLNLDIPAIGTGQAGRKDYPFQIRTRRFVKRRLNEFCLIYLWHKKLMPSLSLVWFGGLPRQRFRSNKRKHGWWRL